MVVFVLGGIIVDFINCRKLTVQNEMKMHICM